VKWIKCSERMPEEMINVLLWYEDTVKFGWMRHDKTTFELESDCCKGQRFHISYVTHWMPLPKGPDMGIFVDEIYRKLEGAAKEKLDMPMLTPEEGAQYKKECDERFPYRDEARMWLHAEKYSDSLKESNYEAYLGIRMIMDMIRWSHLYPERMKGFFESPKDLYKVEWSNFHEEFLKNIKDAPPIHDK